MHRSHQLIIIGAVLGSLCITPVSSAQAQELKFLKVTPSALKQMDTTELNLFGLNAANEVYAALYRVGSATGQIGGKLNQADRAAVKNVKNLIADKALIQTSRTNYGMTKNTYIPSDVDTFKISDLKLTHPATDVLVVSYEVTLPNRVDLQAGVMMSSETLPRLTVLQWNKALKQWQIFSHADFDSPSASLCGSKPVAEVKKGSFSKKDNQLGAQVMTEFVAAMLSNRLKDQVLNGYQYVYASGEKQAEDGRFRTRIEKQVPRANLEAVQSGRLLAIRYDTQSALSVDGEAVDQSMKPRLFTFYKNDKGEWRFVASAVFSYTAKISAGINCVKPTVR
jgi:hypothetical protein